MDVLLDDGPQPEHARHLEHQRDLQPAPGHRRDLPAGQRTDVADRPAQRDGRPRNGLHGARFARSAFRARRPTTAPSSKTSVGWHQERFVQTLVRGTIDMFEQTDRRRIKACWIICTNPVATVANRKTVITGLETRELVITQDAYRDTATNRYADVVLPAALWAESDAVMVNSDAT